MTAAAVTALLQPRPASSVPSCFRFEKLVRSIENILKLYLNNPSKTGVTDVVRILLSLML
jgi:hypothetical protein